jgi:hypothetical protein
MNVRTVVVRLLTVDDEVLESGDGGSVEQGRSVGRVSEVQRVPCHTLQVQSKRRVGEVKRKGENGSFSAPPPSGSRLQLPSFSTFDARHARTQMIQLALSSPTDPLRSRLKMSRFSFASSSLFTVSTPSVLLSCKALNRLERADSLSRGDSTVRDTKSLHRNLRRKKRKR